MNKRNNKKGFTITELVIVIVVIAILAAVLIPTFASLIKKANVSADTQLAKNLNTALTMAEASGEKIEDFGDALEAITEAGYVLAKLNPTAEGHYFAWESESNQILLVDSEKEWAVVYKSKELKNATIGETWWFAISDAPAEIIAYLEEKGANIANAPKDGEALKNTLESIFEEGGEQTVYISSGVDLTEGIKMDNPDAKVTLDLTNSNLDSDGVLGSAAITVAQGELTVKNGVVNALGQMLDADGEPSKFPLDTKEGTYTKIEGTTFNIDTDMNGYLRFYGDADVVGATITSGDMGLGAYGGSAVTVEDTTINATGHGAFFVSSHSNKGNNGVTKLTVKSGTYRGGDVDGTDYKAYCLNAYSGELTITGGTFTSNQDDKMFFVHNEAGAKITITGGTFNGVEYSQLTVEKLNEMSNLTTWTGSVANGFVITSGK